VYQLDKIKIILIPDLFTPSDIKTAKSFSFFEVICIIDEHKLNDATNIINDRVKNVIFFSISVASKSWRFRSFQDNISDDEFDITASELLNSKYKFSIEDSLSNPKIRESSALKILLVNIFATTNSLTSGIPK